MAQSQSGTAKVELDDKQAPAPKRIMKAVFKILRARGYDVVTVADMETAAHEDISGGLTPAWSQDALDMDNAGVLDHMDLKDELEGCFGEPSGSGHVTTVFGRAGRSVAETVALLDERGHIETAINRAVDEESPDGIDLTDSQKEKITSRATDMVAYKLAEFAKGWVAEKTIIEGTERFAKAGIANDIGGQDAYDRKTGKYVQIKSVTYGYNQSDPKLNTDGGAGNHTHGDKETPIIYYQWDCGGGLWFGRDHTDVNGRAADVKGHKGTTIARTHSAYTYNGRQYRKHWW